MGQWALRSWLNLERAPCLPLALGREGICPARVWRLGIMGWLWWAGMLPAIFAWPDAPWRGRVVALDPQLPLAAVETTSPAGGERLLVEFSPLARPLLSVGEVVMGTLQRHGSRTDLTEVSPFLPAQLQAAAAINEARRATLRRTRHHTDGGAAIRFGPPLAAFTPDGAWVTLGAPEAGQAIVFALLSGASEVDVFLAQRFQKLIAEAEISGFTERVRFAAVMLTPRAVSAEALLRFGAAVDPAAQSSALPLLWGDPHVWREAWRHWQVADRLTPGEPGVLLFAADGKLTHRWLGSAWQVETVIEALPRP